MAEAEANLDGACRSPAAVTGGCLCSAVRYEIRGPLRDIVVCHCPLCRRFYGAPGMHTKARKVDIVLTEERGLRWFASSERARRGFCGECGSGLFWEPFELDATGIAAGSLDGSPGLKVLGHIFVGDKASFYEIDDDLPQFRGSSLGRFPDDEL